MKTLPWQPVFQAPVSGLGPSIARVTNTSGSSGSHILAGRKEMGRFIFNVFDLMQIKSRLAKIIQHILIRIIF